MKEARYLELDRLWLKLREVECLDKKNWRLQLDYMKHHVLMIAISTKVKIVVDGNMFILMPGHACVFLPGQLMQAAIVAAHPKGLYVFQFDVIDEISDRESILEITRARSNFPLQGDIGLTDASAISELCYTIWVHWRSVEAIGRMRSQAAFQELLCRMLEDGQASDPDEDRHLSVKRTMDYLAQFSHLPMTIEELAEMAGMSRYYYMRSFKQLNGRSVMDYLSELRINQAKVLMENPKMKLRDIAKQVGYQDEYYFIRKFKQQVGIPPATYMKNKQRKVAAYSFPNIGQLLALKIVPFAAPMDHYWTDMYRRKYQYDVVTPLSHDYDFNRQALQASKPDYILGIDHFIPAEEQEKLQEVAPAFFVPWLSNDWRTHLRLIAQFLGIEDVAEIWLKDYALKAAKVKDLVNDVFKGDAVLIVHISEEHIYVYGERSIASVLYQDLDIRMPKGIGAKTSHTLVTLEQLADYDAERLMVMFTNGRSTQENWDLLKKKHAWNELKAVRNQSVTSISPWLWFEYSAYTQERFLNEVATIVKA